uniref:Uncharacterized protein n=1 Tax=Arundo donax TaxID=35708 RepID=A0A0A8ZPJ8_ARUDO
MTVPDPAAILHSCSLLPLP